jgi:hypothetical protein
MAPPHVHINWLESFRAGCPPTITVREPGAHGAVVTGTQGWGVSTPNAADVAAATIGLLKVTHKTNPEMFAMGLLSIIFAAGWLLTITLLLGNTINEPGAVPKEH